MCCHRGLFKGGREKRVTTYDWVFLENSGTEPFFRRMGARIRVQRLIFFKQGNSTSKDMKV